MPPKHNLLGFSPTKLQELCREIGEPRFRAKQLLKWIHQEQQADFSKMSNIPHKLQSKLAEIAEVTPPKLVSMRDAPDSTRKFIFELDAKNFIETIYIPSKNHRGTLCISSQIGCALNCSFCLTGKQGFNRDLSSAEIIGQVLVALQNLPENHRLTNVVFMGMGEPLLNTQQVFPAVELLLDDNCYGLSKRKVTISTSGIIPGILEMDARLDVSLALSLHAPNNSLRDELVPINKKYPLEDLLLVLHTYLNSKPHKRHLLIEYVMLDGVNDSLEQARELSQLLKPLSCKVNLIPFNPFPGSGYTTSKRKQILAFQNSLINSGYVCTIRKTMGDSILAACGQLAGRIQDRTTRTKARPETTKIKSVEVF